MHKHITRKTLIVNCSIDTIERIDTIVNSLVVEEIYLIFKQKSLILKQIDNALSIHAEFEIDMPNYISDISILTTKSDLSIVTSNIREQSWKIDLESSTWIAYSQDWDYHNSASISEVEYCPLWEPELTKDYIVCTNKMLQDMKQHFELSRTNILRDKHGIISFTSDEKNLYIFSTNSYVLYSTSYSLDSIQIKNILHQTNISIYFPVVMKTIIPILLKEELHLRFTREYIIFSTLQFNIAIRIQKPAAINLQEIITDRQSRIATLNIDIIRRLISAITKLKLNKRTNIVNFNISSSNICVSLTSTITTYRETFQLKNDSADISFSIDIDVLKALLSIAKTYNETVHIHSMKEHATYFYLLNEQNDNILVFTVL